jgi:uncharacterized membrane protein HdeD (DUF308 family)
MKDRIPILMNIYRGGAAIVLAILLFVIPDKSKGFLFNLMGFFWLSIGFTILRRSQDDKRYPGKKVAWIAGLVAVVTGLLVVTRRFTRQWVGEDFFFILLGTVILATGLLHMFGQQRIGGFRQDRDTRIHFYLGVFEVLLGGLLLFSRNVDQPIVYWAATAWAFFYGLYAFITAVRSYRSGKQEASGSFDVGHPEDG